MTEVCIKIVGGGDKIERFDIPCDTIAAKEALVQVYGKGMLKQNDINVQVNPIPAGDYEFHVVSQPQQVDQKITVLDLLNITIPKLQCDDPTACTTNSTEYCYQKVLKDWSDFIPNVNPLNLQLDDRVNRYHCDNKVRTEAAMEGIFKVFFCDHLNQISNIGRIEKRTQTSVLVPGSITACDEIMYDEDGVFAVQEMKMFNNLDDMPSAASDVVECYGDGQNFRCPAQKALSGVYGVERTEIPTADGMRKWYRAIAQLYGYMKEQKVAYGALSCYNRSWFVHAVAGGLEITNAYHCDCGHVLLVYAYFMHRAKSDRMEPACFPRKRRLMDEEKTIGPPSPSPPDKNDGDPDYNQRDGSSGPQKKSCTRSSSSASAPVTHMSLLDCTDIHALGEGRLGLVLGCTYQAVPLAVKFVDCAKGDVATLMREKECYRRLHALQGVCIPRIHCYEVSSTAGMMTGFAMDRLDPLPQEFHQWTAEQKASGRQALRTLLTQGRLMHQDIRECNFGLAADGSVQVFDLEDTVICSSNKQQDRYFRKLDGIMV